MPRNPADTNSDEELFDLNPIEVTLTIAPAVKEAFLMSKSELTQDELKEIAKSLGIEEIADIPVEVISKAVADKQETEKEDYDQMMKQLTKKSSVPIAAAAKILESVKSSLPPEIAAYFASVTKAFPPKPDEEDDEDKQEGPEPADGNAPTPKDKKPNPFAKSEVIAVMKSAFPGVIKAITDPLEEELKETRKSVDALVAERDYQDALAVAKTLSPDPETSAKTLMQIKKSLNTKDYDAYVKSQQTMYAAVAKSEAFKVISKSNGDNASAEDKLMAMADEIVSKSEKPGDSRTKANALEAVMKNNPDLARRYNAEMRERAATVGNRTED